MLQRVHNRLASQFRPFIFQATRINYKISTGKNDRGERNTKKPKHYVPFCSDATNLSSEDTPEGQLLRERAKWFGHVIPNVSLKALDVIRSDSDESGHFPEKGNLLILNDWKDLVSQRNSIDVAPGNRWIATQETIEQVIAAIQSFFTYQMHGSTDGKTILIKSPLVVLIPSSLEPSAATEEQLVLEQAIRMHPTCLAYHLDCLVSVWVMCKDETWRWTESLIEGSVSASWPLRCPSQPLTSPLFLIHHRKLNHIMPHVSLTDINTVLSFSPPSFPMEGHLLLLRCGDVGTWQPVVKRVMALIPLVEQAIKTFADKHSATMKLRTGPPLVLLVFSSLKFADAEDLQRLLHLSVLMAPMIHYFPEELTVRVLTKEETQRVEAAYVMQEVGRSWVNEGGLPKPASLKDRTEAVQIPNSHFHPCSAELLCHEEVDGLWCTTAENPVGVDALEGLLSPKILEKIQQQLHNAVWKPAKMHVLACRVGAEQLENSTDMLFKALMQIAAIFFCMLTGSELLREAITQNEYLHSITSLEEFHQESEEVGTNSMRDGNMEAESNAKFVKLTLLVYIDSLGEDETNLLRTLLRSFYNLLPSQAREIILTVEVPLNSSPPIKKCETKSSCIPLCDTADKEIIPVETRSAKEKEETLEATDSGAVTNSDTSLGPPLTSEAPGLYANTQFHKSPEHRRKNIHAEMMAQEKRVPVAELCSTQPPQTSDSTPAEGITTKAELKALLEDAVEEVTARHEQAMSHLVDTMAKMVGAWTSETFMEELNATIKQGIEPLQEHLSESGAAFSKFRRGIMTEELGREIVAKLDALLAMLSSRNEFPLVDPSCKPQKLAIGFDSNAPQTSPTPHSVSGSSKKLFTLSPVLVFNSSEIRFLNSAAKKRLRSRSGVSRKFAKAWLSAEKNAMPNRQNRFTVKLPNSFVTRESGKELVLLKTIVIHLIECTFLSKVRSARAFYRERHKKETLTPVSRGSTDFSSLAKGEGSDPEKPLLSPAEIVGRTVLRSISGPKPSLLRKPNTVSRKFFSKREKSKKKRWKSATKSSRSG